jgi:alpha-ketoglutarate-dependent taurine dioxygenase
MPNLPFWCQQAHKTKVLSSYRALQRLALEFKDKLHQRYLYYEIRERFRYYRHNTSPRQTNEQLLEAEKVMLQIISC